jgi:hypothetical protein
VAFRDLQANFDAVEPVIRRLRHNERTSEFDRHVRGIIKLNGVRQSFRAKVPGS